MKITFLIRSLEQGGAERQLVCLANGLAAKGHQVAVAVFYGKGELESELKGVQLFDLKKSGRWDVIAFLVRLIGYLREQKPNVLHSYLGTANILSILLKPFQPRTKVVWGVRASNMDLSQYDWLTRWSFALERALSGFAGKIIVNSQAGFEYASQNSFPQNRMEIVLNGVDTDRFKTDRASGLSVRSEWGVSDDDILVGIVARLDPMKAHKDFMAAAQIVTEVDPSIRFVCVGDGLANYKDKLKNMAKELGIDDRVVWAGSKADMPKVYNALDICCLSSISEGFPNVLGEAMSCGVPCVTTDVGDAAQVVADTGLIVPKGNPQALATALLEMARRVQNGDILDTRSRIVRKFSKDQMVEQTEIVLTRVCQ